MYIIIIHDSASNKTIYSMQILLTHSFTTVTTCNLILTSKIVVMECPKNNFDPLSFDDL